MNLAIRYIYNDARGVAKRTVWLAKSEAKKVRIRDSITKWCWCFYIAKEMNRANQDVSGNCVHNDVVELELTELDQIKAWVEHYTRPRSGGEPTKVKCNYIWANVITFVQM